ncbi:MAG TPA: oligopeptide/dipeptide ABC transporter ATP-binding protein [Solimonas sp.]|nr:oligopeptide/dipeptide ABC transporter ATP-binding protein [Solimonas sp.]
MTAPVAPLLAVRQLRVEYRLRPDWPWQAPPRVRAVEDLNFNLYPGETLGIVGESGSGKSTLARALVGLEPISAGAASFAGQDLVGLREPGWRALRRDIQMVFQDPLASLDPRMSIGASVAEPLEFLCPEIGADERAARVRQLLERVGIPAAEHHRYPQEFSGGQCQRVGIARALIVQPRLLICDEPVSALDVSVQAQVLNLLRELQRERGLAMLFIGHDLAVVRHVSQRVLVLYFGRAMEQGAAAQLFSAPRHPYTRALLAAIPGVQAPPEHRLLEGELPSPLHPPPGCAFATRCPMADEQCTRRPPHSRRFADGGMASCHYAVDSA